MDVWEVLEVSLSMFHSELVVQFVLWSWMTFFPRSSFTCSRTADGKLVRFFLGCSWCSCCSWCSWYSWWRGWVKFVHWFRDSCWPPFSGIWWFYWWSSWWNQIWENTLSWNLNMILSLLTPNFSQWMGIAKNNFSELADDNGLISNATNGYWVELYGALWQTFRLLFASFNDLIFHLPTLRF